MRTVAPVSGDSLAASAGHFTCGLRGAAMGLAFCGGQHCRRSRQPLALSALPSPLGPRRARRSRPGRRPLDGLGFGSFSPSATSSSARPGKSRFHPPLAFNCNGPTCKHRATSPRQPTSICSEFWHEKRATRFKPTAADLHFVIGASGPQHQPTNEEDISVKLSPSRRTQTSTQQSHPRNRTPRNMLRRHCHK